MLYFIAGYDNYLQTIDYQNVMEMGNRDYSQGEGCGGCDAVNDSKIFQSDLMLLEYFMWRPTMFSD